MSLIFDSLCLLANLQRAEINTQQLQQILTEHNEDKHNPLNTLLEVSRELSLTKPKRIKKINDPSELPLLIYDGESWGVVKSFNAKNQWVVQSGTTEKIVNELTDAQIFKLTIKVPLLISKSKTFQMVKIEMLKHKKLLVDAFIAGVFINIVAVVSAFYSMQIYDRVVPSGAKQTLLVLTIGVFVIIFLELIAKLVRSGLYEKLIEKIDKKLARDVYQRFLSLRLDQLPKSVGTLSGQMRGFESVRNFLSSITTYLMVDIPFVLFYVFLIFLIGGFLALVPVIFFILAVIIGLYFHKKIEKLANNINETVNLKTGLLVESIEGAESIKSGQGGWRMLSNWTSVNDDSRQYDLEMKRVSDSAQYMVAFFQQLSFISIVASGSLLISEGELTMGGLIACSILSGRVLAPVAQIPSHLVSWANTKAAIQSLDRIWTLKADYDGIDNQIIMNHLKGNFHIFANTQINYGNKLALSLSELHIKAGEKIGILGAIGSGKTTLLRLLSGMYHPKQGKVLLDGVDLSHIAKPNLAENIGFLQQDARLFKGSLRENIVLGLGGVSDDEILAVAKQTKLMDSVVSNNDKGLDFEIFEGGVGLSGGQRQLLNLSRIFLKKPKIWLLDEPTASLDSSLEQHLINLLKQKLTKNDTLVLVTHKSKMLDLVDRLIVINNNQIVMDGAKNEVIKKIKAKS